MMPADDLAALNAPARRGWARWRRGWRLAAVVVASIALTTGIAAGVTASPVFRARTIRIVGTDHLTRAEVLQLAGITSKTNVFYLDANDAEQRLERDVWVAGATIAKDLPSTVVIDVRERVAVAVAGPKDRRMLVAEDGTTLGDAGAGALLPSIGVPVGDPEPSAAAVNGAARAIAALGPNARRQVMHVSILPDGTLLVRLTSGAVITWGTAEEPDVKATALGVLLRWAAKQGAHLTSADVHVPSNPTAEVAPGLDPTP